jgi:three-Cys-motif partner protein
VRPNGQYARLKLEFLDRYLPAALNATKRKLRRVYIDLFAGPGVNSDGRIEFPGGALRALGATGTSSETPFTDAVLVNLDSADHVALTERVNDLCRRGESRVPLERIRLVHGDANELLGDILRRFDPSDYLLVFADIEAPRQLPFDTLRVLRAKHASVDLYVLFPLDMALRRLLAYNPRRRDEWAPILDAFFGCRDWRESADELRANPSRRDELGRQLTTLYCRQLMTLWEHAAAVVDVHLRKRRRLYRMVFAASHAAAERIKMHIQRAMTETAKQGQGDLF